MNRLILKSAFFIAFVALLGIQSKGQVTAAFSFTNNCQGKIHSFTDASTGGVTTWEWDFGDASGFSYTQNTSHIYSTPGAYNVRLVVTDGAAFNDTLVQVITVYANPSVTTTTTNVSCNGLGNGAATASVAGGTAPYSYSWMNGVTNATNTNLYPGSYGVTVTDNAGCSASTSAIITQPSAISGSLSTTNNTCFASGDGSISLTASGGSGGYTYYWSDGSVTQNISSLFAGSYTVSITDGNGCMANYSANITQPAGIAVGVLSLTDVSCNGGSNGSVTLQSTGGTGTFAYSWNNGDSVEVSNSLIAGAYMVTATDANGCTGTTTFTVNEPTMISMTVTVNNVTCNGLADGSLSIDLLGGAGGFSYSLNTVGGNPSLSNLAAGSYLVEVTDVNGCYVYETVNILEPSPISVAINSSDETASGVCDGQMTATVTGGSGSYSYNWSNGMAAVSTLDSLCVGTYNVSINDTNGCSTSASASIGTAVICTFSATYTSTNETSSGACDGTVTITTTGGTLPITYDWNGISTSTTEFADSICAGGYSVYINDANGCDASLIEVVNVGTSCTFSASITQTSTSCIDSNSGKLIASATSGTAPFSFNWDNNGFANDTLQSVPVGIYNVSGTDAMGCTFTGSYQVYGPNAISATVFATNETSIGGCDGNVFASYGGGNGAVSYLWSDGNTAQSVTVCAGTYFVTVTDELGCSASNSGIVSSDSPSACTANAGADQLVCAGTDATLNGSVLIASGGIWTSTGTGVFSNANILNPTYTPSAGDIASGSVILVLTTTGGGACSDVSDTLVVTISPIATANAGADQTICSYDQAFLNGSITVAATANWSTTGTGSFSPNSSSLTASYIPSAGDIAFGQVLIALTTTGGCSASDSMLIQIGSEISITGVVTNSTCGNPDGSVDATVTGGTAPYTYAWSNSGSLEDMDFMLAGEYYLGATDQNGCFAQTDFVVSDIDGPTVSLDSIVNANCGAMDGHIYVTATGGAAPLGYAWSNSSTQEDLKASAGNYTLVVTDANGCIGGVAAEILQDGVNAPSVSGVVTRDLNGNFINSGLVEVIQVSTGITRASSALSSGGFYSIPTLHPVGDYVLKASPDVAIYPNAIPTYYGLTTLWNSAIVTNMQCDNNYVIDFEVIDLTPLSGTSTILGLIVADTTGGQFKMGAGDPIPGVDVSLEQVPGGIIAHTQTGDGTGGTTNGVFTFENVPSSANPYRVLVDIPGSEQLEEHEVTVTTDNSTVTNLNYVLAEEGIIIAGPNSVREVKESITIGVYPNPFKNELTITYQTEGKELVKIELTDMLGKSTALLNQHSTQKGTYIFKTNTEEMNLSNGVYFLKTTIGDNSNITRVVKM